MYSCIHSICQKLRHRPSNITRGTVQKSVVVMSRLPLYGLIGAKLQTITHLYFKELDFSKVSLLEETYHSLNAQLNYNLMKSCELYAGLTPRLLVINFEHKIVLLFKLLLLERKVLFYKSPVKELCVSILSLCSLMPALIEEGLHNSCVSVHPKHSQNTRQLSSDLEFNDSNDCNHCLSDEELYVISKDNTSVESTQVDNKYIPKADIDSDDDLLKQIDEVLSEKSSNSSKKSNQSSPGSEPTSQSIFYDTIEPKPERADKITAEEAEQQRSTQTPPILKLSNTECGLPLQIFSCGSYLQPYLSLTYLDVLTDPRVRSCLVGATNILFKQKKDLFDVIVEVINNFWALLYAGKGS